jgi:hypothetical protein
LGCVLCGSSKLFRPIAAIGAFDSPTYVIDISPFIPLLSDSKAHNFTLFVQGQGENGSINPDWIFSASVFASLDPSGARTTGKILTHSTDSKTTVGAASAASTPPKIDPKDLVSFVTHSFRYLSISSTVVTGTGGSQVFKTEQDMTFINQQSWLPGGAYQVSDDALVQNSKARCIRLLTVRMNLLSRYPTRILTVGCDDKSRSSKFEPWR